jgi:hypothetical protein
VLPDPLQLKIDFDRLVITGADRNFFPANYSRGSEIGTIGRINDNPVNVSVSEWLTPQIKHGRMHIEEIRKTELARLCSGGACMAFYPSPSDPVICESKMGCDFLGSIILRLPRLDGPQGLRIGH